MIRTLQYLQLLFGKEDKIMISLIDSQISSICQTYSWASLDIPGDTLHTLKSHYNVAHEFMPVLKSFYFKTMELEEGFITSPWKRIKEFYPDGRLAYGKQLFTIFIPI